MKFLSFDLMRDKQGIACDRQRHFSHTMPQSHYHTHYEILYITEGSRELVVNDKSSFKLDRHNIAFIKPYVPHKTISDDGCQYTRILVNFSSKNAGALRGISDYDILFPFNLKSPVMTFEKSVISEIDSIMKKLSGNYSEDMKRIMLLELLTYIWEIKGNKEKVSTPFSENVIEKICEYINENYEKDISLDMLSEMFFINKYHLSRSFKKYMNISFTDYLNNIRISKAKEILKKGVSVTDAALFSGYSGITHFERMFKRKEGITPKEWKKQIIKNKE